MKVKAISVWKTSLLSALFSVSGFVAADVGTFTVLPTPYNDGVVVDKKGTVYVSNAGRFGPSGLEGSVVHATTQGGETSVWQDGLEGPLGIAFDKEGNFFTSNHRSWDVAIKDKHGEQGIYTSIVGAGGIAIDQNHEMYISSYQASAIYKKEKNGDTSVYSADPRLNGPVGISFDKNHNLYVGNYNDGKILKINKKGVVSEIATVPGGGVGYIVYAGGNIYATAIFDNKIYKVSLDGEVTHFAGTGEFGGIDGENMNATFSWPNGLATNKEENKLYISEYFSYKVRVIDL